MAFIRWILGVLIATALALFAGSNLHDVDVYVTPFHPAVALPLYLIAVAFLTAGFLFGAGMIWLGTMPLRYRSYRQKRQIKALENQLKPIDKIHTNAPMGDFFPALPQRVKKDNDT